MISDAIRRLVCPALVLAVPTFVLAREPLKPDVTQQDSLPGKHPLDHLEPVSPSDGIQEFYYLAQYWASFSDPAGEHYVVVVRDFPPDANFIPKGSPVHFSVEQGDPPKLFISSKHPYRFKHKASISQDTASLIHSLWVNILSQTRYEPTDIVVLGGYFRFSAWTRGLFYHGKTDFGFSHELPPGWIVQSGEALYSYALGTITQKQLRDVIASNRKKFYDYIRKRD